MLNRAVCSLLLLNFALIGCAEVEANKRPRDFAALFAQDRGEAEAGDVQAQYRLGRDYERALGTEQDLESAEQWYRKAAEAGDLAAMTALGNLIQPKYYLRDTVLKEDWLLRAADAGYAEAMLAEAHYRAFPAGRDWLEGAAAAGSPEAKAELVQVLARSKSLEEQSRAEAYSAEIGRDFPNALFAVELAKSMRERPTGKFSVYEVTPGMHQAALRLDVEETMGGAGSYAYYTFAVLQGVIGHPISMDPGGNGAVLRAEVHGTLRQRAEHGDLQSSCNLGFLLDNEKDYANAFSAYRIAAVKGAPRAAYHLGLYYRDGRGTDRDSVKAAEWFRRAAEQGYIPAQAALGAQLMNDEDYPEAVQWLRPAAARDNPLAQYSLGLLYRNGLGVPRNNALAVTLISKAARVWGGEIEVSGRPAWPDAVAWLEKGKSDPDLAPLIDQFAVNKAPVREFLPDANSAKGGCGTPVRND